MVQVQSSLLQFVLPGHVPPTGYAHVLSILTSKLSCIKIPPGSEMPKVQFPFTLPVHGYDWLCPEPKLMSPLPSLKSHAPPLTVQSFASCDKAAARMHSSSQFTKTACAVAELMSPASLSPAKFCLSGLCSELVSALHPAAKAAAARTSFIVWQEMNWSTGEDGNVWYDGVSPISFSRERITKRARRSEY